MMEDIITAPKDPEKPRAYFYIMRGKEVFGAKQPDGRGIQFIYENDGRLISGKHNGFNDVKTVENNRGVS